MTERRRAAVLAVLLMAMSLMVALPREGAAAQWFNPLLNYEPLMGDPDGPDDSSMRLPRVRVYIERWNLGAPIVHLVLVPKTARQTEEKQSLRIRGKSQ